jgi:hypothetical protein
MLAMALPSLDGDDAAEITWAQRDVDAESCTMAVRCRCRVMLVMALPSLADAGAIEVTWVRCNVDAKSC